MNFKISVIILTIFILALFVFNASTTLSGDKLLTCEVRNVPCNLPNETILKMSSLSNAHAEMASQANYNYYLCCGGSFSIGSDCGDNSTTSVINLSGVTNAHVEKKDLGNYSEEICLSSKGSFIFDCDYDTDCGNLGLNYECLASISEDTNAHIGDCLAYSTKICCEVIPKNTSPKAKFRCDPNNCVAYSGSDTPILRLVNQSTDPDGQDDIVKSEWEILDQGWANFECTGNNSICDFPIPSTFLPNGEYDVKLTITDDTGETDSKTKTITMRYDIDADFECSLSGEEGDWYDCDDFKGVQEEYTYFKDISTPSEEASSISSWAWEINDVLFAGNVSTSSVKISGKSNTVKLTVTDNDTRIGYASHTFGAKLPLPTWQEIGS